MNMAKSGPAGSMAATAIYGAASRQAMHKKELGLRQQQIKATSDLARARMGYDMYKDEREFGNKTGQQNKAAMDEEFKSMAEGAVPAKSMEFDKTRQANVAAKTEENRRIFTRSAAAAGVDPTRMNRQQRVQLHQLMKVRDSVTQGRDNWMDMLGNHQVDSDNAYGFQPVKVDPAARPGEKWIVHMQNGNRIALKELAGGKFSMWGANQPIDADVMALIKPLIEKANGSNR